MKDMLENRRCKNCGGALTESSDGKFRCDSCGSVFTDYVQTGEERTALNAAYLDLRTGKFEDADEKFDVLMKRFPKNHEAYWGALLSKYGVVYVDDVLENKKVPTCFNTIAVSLLNDKLFHTAVSLAPKDVKESYREQAGKIEKIRAEWCEKASKEEPYDIFICFKDSDRENNIERTEDSVDAAEIYHYLSKKYRVFFSRETLRGKVAEHYEPYIFNAIKTAQVMIVYGSKPEYINSVWVKNEWTRYLKRIKDGEKQPNSLVVACKNMDFYDLPKQLTGGRQGLDARSVTFLSDLESHIEKVLYESGAKGRIERVKVQGIEVGKKVSAVEVKKIKTREFGTVSLKSLTASEDGAMKIAEKMLDMEEFGKAERMYENVIAQNARNGYAILGSLLAKTENCTIEEFFSAPYSQTASYADLLENAISNMAESDAVDILNKFTTQCIEDLNSDTRDMYESEEIGLERLFNVVSKFAFPCFKELALAVLAYAQLSGAVSLFDVALAATQNTDPDFHIFALKGLSSTLLNQGNSSAAKTVCDRMLEIDSGNVDAMWIWLLAQHGLRTVANIRLSIAPDWRISDVSIEEIDGVLKYCTAQDAETLICGATDNLCSQKSITADDVKLFDELIKRTENKQTLIDMLVEFAKKILETNLRREDAKKYLALAIAEDGLNVEARKCLLAEACGARSYETILKTSTVKMEGMREYDDLMIAAQMSGNDDLLEELILLPEKQIAEIDSRENMLQRAREARDNMLQCEKAARENELRTRNNEARYKKQCRNKTIAKIIRSISFALLAVFSVLYHIMFASGIILTSISAAAVFLSTALFFCMIFDLASIFDDFFGECHLPSIFLFIIMVIEYLVFIIIMMVSSGKVIYSVGILGAIFDILGNLIAVLVGSVVVGGLITSLSFVFKDDDMKGKAFFILLAIAMSILYFGVSFILTNLIGA